MRKLARCLSVQVSAAFAAPDFGFAGCEVMRFREVEGQLYVEFIVRFFYIVSVDIPHQVRLCFVRIIPQCHTGESNANKAMHALHCGVVPSVQVEPKKGFLDPESTVT